MFSLTAGRTKRLGKSSKPSGPRDACGASDFAPALEFVSLPQTMEWQGSNALSETEQRMVFRDNLVRLLAGPYLA